MRRHPFQRRLFQNGAVDFLGAGCVGSGTFSAPDPIHTAGKNVFLAAGGDGSGVAVGVTGAINDAHARWSRSGTIVHSNDTQTMNAVAIGNEATNCRGIVGCVKETIQLKSEDPIFVLQENQHQSSQIEKF